MKARHMVIEIAGWYGSIAILAGFFLVSQGYISAQSPLYLIGNATGAAGIALQAYAHRAMPSVFLNVVYLFVALFGIARFIF